MQQHLLEKYPEATINDNRVIPATPEKRLVKKYYETKHERESLLGQASRYITIKYENKKYYPVFDPRYEKEVAALHFKMLESEKAEEELLKKIDQISGKFEIGLKELHEERKACETRITQMSMFPTEQEALRVRHKELNDLITEYTAILGPDI